MMDLVTYSILFIAFTVLSTWLMAFAYRKVQYAMKHRYQHVYSTCLHSIAPDNVSFLILMCLSGSPSGVMLLSRRRLPKN